MPAQLSIGRPTTATAGGPTQTNRATPLGSVRFRVSRCVDLLRDGTFPVLDPFVKVSFGSATACTRVLRAQTAPGSAKGGARPRTAGGAPSPAPEGPTAHAWDEDLPPFSISVEDVAAARELLVEVYDYEVMKGDRLIGSASLSLVDALEADPGLALQEPPQAPPKPPELPDRPLEFRLPLRVPEQQTQVGEAHVAARLVHADGELEEVLENLRKGVPLRLVESHDLLEAPPSPRPAFQQLAAGPDEPAWGADEWWAEQQQPAGAAQVLVRVNGVASLSTAHAIPDVHAEVTIGSQRLRVPVRGEHHAGEGYGESTPDVGPILDVPFVAEDPDAELLVDIYVSPDDQGGEGALGRAAIRLADTGVPLDGQFHALTLELEAPGEDGAGPLGGREPVAVSVDLAMLPVAGAAEAGKLRELWVEMEARTAASQRTRFISLDARPPIFVDASGQTPGAYRTLREAVAVAGPGQRVAVHAGRYVGSVHVFRSVQIEGVGESRDDVVLSATDESVLVSTARGASVRNLTIAQMGGKGLPAVGVMAGDLLLENCDVSSRGHACVSVHSGADPTIANCSIHDALSGPGLWFHDEGTKGRVEGCEISRCRSSGVSIEGGAGPLLLRNAIHDCSGPGVSVHSGGRGALLENDVYRNGPCELLLRGAGTDPLVKHNALRLARRAALVVEQNAKGQVLENDVMMSEGNGISVTTGANPLLTSNRVVKCARIGVHVHSGGRGCLAVNEVADCREFALVVAPQCKPVLRANAFRGRTSVPV
eukprot:tig00021094_g18108.t1